MAQESLKDEAELLKPTTASSSSSSPSPASQPPPTRQDVSTTTPPPPTRQDASTTTPPPPQLSSTPFSPPSPLFLKTPEETPKQSQEDGPCFDAPALRAMNCGGGRGGGSVHRCSSCKKRVGLTGFRCRCGEVFCWRHRYSDAHDCSFDYKAAGRVEISKANPLIRAAKIIKI